LRDSFLDPCSADSSPKGPLKLVAAIRCHHEGWQELTIGD
jgi:hypothetical protein